MKQLAPGVALAALIALTLAACQKPAAAPDRQTNEPARSLTVSGEGFVSAKPDLAVTTVGVVSQGATAADALTENTKRMTKLIDLVKSLDIEERDIQTSNLSVSPRYSAPDPAQPAGERLIVGYDASNEVTLRIRNIGQLGDILDKVVSLAGANNLRGIGFDFASPDPLLDEARKNAVADARRKAALYAEAAGIKLGPIQSIGESGGYYPKPAFAMASRAMAAPVPVAAGESRVSASVTITYAIE
jgi:uncharacterized protein